MNVVQLNTPAAQSTRAALVAQLLAMDEQALATAFDRVVEAGLALEAVAAGGLAAGVREEARQMAEYLAARATNLASLAAKR